MTIFDYVLLYFHFLVVVHSFFVLCNQKTGTFELEIKYLSDEKSRASGLDLFLLIRYSYINFFIFLAIICFSLTHYFFLGVVILFDVYIFYMIMNVEKLNVYENEDVYKCVESIRNNLSIMNLYLVFYYFLLTMNGYDILWNLAPKFLK